jgi:ATP-binding cassette, subfamily B, bacterial PglK
MKNLKLLRQIFPRSKKLQLITIVFLLFISMIFEIFSIGLLIPILNIISNSELINKYLILNEIFEYLKLTSMSSKSLFLLIIFLIFYIIKTVFLIFINFNQNKFIQMFVRDVNLKIYDNYINLEFTDFIKRNTSEYIKNLHLEIIYFTVYIQAFITLTAETILVITIFSIFIFIDPISSILLFLFFLLFSFSFFRLTRKKLKKWGKKRELIEEKLTFDIQESFNCIRELKTYNARSYFFDRIKNNFFEKSKIMYSQTTLNQAPRFLVELISVSAIILFIIYKINDNVNTDELIITLGVFVAGAFRILPSLNRIISSRHQLKYHENSLEVIYSELNLQNKKISETRRNKKFNNSIELRNISFKYNKNNYILKDLNFSIKKGQIVGIIGKSGSGKSTFVDILCGLINTYEGKIFLDNQELKGNNFTGYISHGYVGQKTNLVDDSIISNVAFGEKKPNLKKVKDSLKNAQLLDFIETLPKKMNTKIGQNGVEFSGGQIQRISIARALYKKSELLILDEATSSLDKKTEEKFLEYLKTLKGKLTLIVIAHDLNTLKYCDKIYSLENKKLIST